MLSLGVHPRPWALTTYHELSDSCSSAVREGLWWLHPQAGERLRHGETPAQVDSRKWGRVQSRQCGPKVPFLPMSEKTHSIRPQVTSSKASLLTGSWQNPFPKWANHWMTNLLNLLNLSSIYFYQLLIQFMTIWIGWIHRVHENWGEQGPQGSGSDCLLTSVSPLSACQPPHHAAPTPPFRGHPFSLSYELTSLLSSSRELGRETAHIA